MLLPSQCVLFNQYSPVFKIRAGESMSGCFPILPQALSIPILHPHAAHLLRGEEKWLLHPEEEQSGVE